MASLQEQLLKAGVVDKKKAQQLKKEKRKQTRQQPKGEPQPDESRQQAQRALAAKAERDRAINREQQAAAEKKAIQAQVIQLIEMNRVARAGGEINYQFADGKKIKKLLVTPRLQQQLSSGQLAIARYKGGYELVPAAVAEKISQRSDDTIALLNTRSESREAEEDPYAAYQIPDDLMW